MSEFFFGVGSRRIEDATGRKIDRIAKRYGARFVWVKLPEGWRYWFSGPNLGHPFDAALRSDVLGAVARELGEGVWS